jgi:DNA-binding FrmR family transcriptional regulator
MVEADRYCADVLTQLAAVQEALRSVGKELLRHHLRHCAADALRAGGKPADSASDELIELFYKNAR